jgi:hypothetical protein
MKKIVIAAFLMLLGIFPTKAQMMLSEDYTKIEARFGGLLGYNVTESTEVIGAFASVSGYYVMGEVELNWNKLDQGENFMSVSPMIGAYYGSKYRIYGLLGITNWGEYDMKHDGEFKKDKIYAKFKIGVDVRLTKNIFVNLNWSYVCGDNTRRYYSYYDDRPARCKSNSLNAGIGLVF